ncbi:MAG TPA: YIP1 family protein [Terracidiphilus sp.]|nr:YIP1 family protein [Terracidiphilus sp.]
MSDVGIQPAAGSATAAPGLTQWQRVAYTFAAPSKTFEDIRRGNRSWWLPLIVLALAGYILFGAVVEKIGIRQTVENQIRMDPKAQERMAQATPEQREQGYKLSDGITEVVFVVAPAIGMLEALVIAAVLMGTINFGFGGRAKFGDVFAVVYYAWLPQMVKVLLGTAVIYAGMAPDSFNIKNFAPTNLGAFLDPTDMAKALYALATSLDVVTIWVVVLMSIGVATVAGVKRSAGYIAVFGWWAIIVVLGVVTAAVMG